MIYFDNAATTIRKPNEVIEAVVNAMTSMGNAGRGSSKSSLVASRLSYDTRKKLANLFNVANPLNIAFTANSTESLNIAIQGVLKEGDHIITSVLEHNSVLRPLYKMQEKKVELSFILADSVGNINIDDIESQIKSNTKAIILTHASNLTGNIVDIEKAGQIAKKHNILFIVDASQSAGVLDIDVEKFNIDILCFTGHKGLLAPQGTGGIYVKEGVDIDTFKVGGTGVKTYDKKQPCEMPTKLEAGTLNLHGIAGLNASLDYILHYGMANIRKTEQNLMEYFYNEVKNIENVKIYGDFSSFNRCAIVSINIGNIDSEIISDILQNEYDICQRAGGHCAPLMHKSFGTVNQGMVRFSFSHFNTKEEIDECIKALKEISNDFK